jgi:hypothetical protein
VSNAHEPAIYKRNPGGRPPNRKDIAKREFRLQMVDMCGRNYEKVVNFWLNVMEGTETYVEHGQKYHRYTTADRIECSKLIMAYGFGKPVQPLTAAFQEQVHKILEIRWKDRDPNDRSKPAEHIEGISASAEGNAAAGVAGSLGEMGESGLGEQEEPA